MTVEEVGALWEYIDKCAKAGSRAKLIFIAITSQVEGKIKSEGLPYGQGKSIFAAILAALIYHKYDAFLGLDIWESVKDNFGYTWDHHKHAVSDAKTRRKLAYIMDDIQRIAGKSKSRDPYVQAWAEFFTTARPFFGVIIFTCPSIGDLAKCFRELINFEIKIPYEGVYEVQLLKALTDYGKPLDPKKRLLYKGEGDIPQAPEDFVKWYIDWRKESSFEEFETRILNYDKKKQKEKQRSPDEVYKELTERGIPVTRAIVRDSMRVKNPVEDGGGYT